MSVPYMPLYVADYQADTSHLTTLEHGAYLLLIMNYWQRGGPLPMDEKKLARIAGISGRDWKRVREAVLPFFAVVGNTYHHSRVDHELDKLRDKSLKKRNGGLARAEQVRSKRSAEGQLIVGIGKEERVPLDKSNGHSPLENRDGDKAFWTASKEYIGGNNPGALIGKWIRETSKEAVADAITAAQVENAVDPKSYITKVLRRHQKAADLWDGSYHLPPGCTA